ncbi:hypothetical protein GSI_03136 [Ganoderma sinense ZZ0214-1]|uniref:DH domain-containing protein n=1 Tax=Ganoderma sinense ZZ0214-1 TaxID=1077348 RepID=A0A2G8SKS1_9APHY|nr:hypothetical protein GSI_03136 [Ganoderma sinense ZZ0214-1]
MPPHNIGQPSPNSNRSRVGQSDSSRGLYSGSETNSDECNSLPNRPRAGKLPTSSIPTPRAPTALQKLRAKTKPKSNPGTPLQNPASSVFGTPQPSQPSPSPFVQTSLPRAKTARFHDLSANDSGAELAHKVDRILSPGRLVVTNAVITPSSSESDNDMSNHRPPPRTSPRNHPTATPQMDRTPRSASQPKSKMPLPTRGVATALRRQNRASVGLGLNVNGVEVDGRRHVKRSSQSSDDEAIYDKYSDSSLMDEPVLFPTTGDDDESIYDDEIPQGFDQRNRLSIHQDMGREEALKGLVDGFHRDYRRSVETNSRSSVAPSSVGPNYAVQGMAISESGDIHIGHSSDSDSRGSHVQDDWGQESIYSDEDVREPKRSLRHTSTRHSWKRPSSAMALRESIYLEQHGHSAIAGSDSDGRRRPVTPTVPSPSPRSKSQRSGATSPQLVSTFSAASSHEPRARTADLRPSGNHKRRLSQRMSVSVRRGNPTFKSPLPPDSGSDTFSSRPVPSSSEASSVDANLRDERQAFGIPDSLSFCGSNPSPDEDESIRPPWSRMNSTASSSSKGGRHRADSNTSDAGWRHHHQKFSKELSRGASALFETLTSKVKSNGRQARAPPDPQDSRREPDRTPVVEPKPWSPRNPTSRSPRPNSGSEVPPDSVRSPSQRCLDSATEPSCSSLGSVYEDLPSLPMPPYPVVRGHAPATLPLQVAPPDRIGSWRSTLAPGVFNSLNIQYGAMEMERQEAIHELVSFDREFVKSSRHIIRSYFLPLRTRDSRAWLPGIPPDMARLFDWLEDIVNLHAAISRAVAPLVVVWKEGMIVECVAGTLRGFVPQLEIYMPYLVKFEGANATLRWYIEKDEGEFGQYLRMKVGEVPGTDGEGALERLVGEPSSRLRKYVELLQRICDTTPQGHPDYLSSISLLYSTRMAVRVMEEVKVREEEYDFVKDLATRVDGLSSTVPLARRARRLLWYGALLYPEPATSSTPKVVARSPESPLKPNALRSPRPSKLTRSPAQRGSKLATASSLLSMQSPDMTPSTSSTSELATPRSGQRLHGFSLLGRSGFRVYDSPKQSQELRQILSGNRVGDRLQERARERMLKVMVFTDVIVLTTALAPDPRTLRDDEEHMDRCRLLDGLGLSRVLDFAESDVGLSLTLIPVRLEQLDTGLLADDTRVAPITLCFPVGTSGGERQRLLDGLRKSQHHTFRSLSMPTLPGTLMEDLEIDTRQSLVGILSSGLPLPKSPSIQFEEAQKGLRRDVADGEREERGWWTLRFHQVLRELQREETLLSFIVPGTFGAGMAS